MLPHGRLPSNSCIGRAPPDFPSPPAHLLRGPSDTALAFLDRMPGLRTDEPSTWTPARFLGAVPRSARMPICIKTSPSVACSHLGQCDNNRLRKRTKLQLARPMGTSHGPSLSISTLLCTATPDSSSRAQGEFWSR